MASILSIKPDGLTGFRIKRPPRTPWKFFSLTRPDINSNCMFGREARISLRELRAAHASHGDVGEKQVDLAGMARTDLKSALGAQDMQSAVSILGHEKTCQRLASSSMLMCWRAFFHPANHACDACV